MFHLNKSKKRVTNRKVGKVIILNYIDLNKQETFSGKNRLTNIFSLR